MITILNKKLDFKSFLDELSQTLNLPVVNGRINLPERIGKGYFAVEELPNGLYVLIIDYLLNTSINFERPASDEEVYFLRFETTRHIKKLTTKIDDELHSEEQSERSLVFLTCSLFDLGFSAAAGTYTHSFSIQLPREWLSRFLKMETYDATQEEYLSLKTEALLVEHRGAAYTVILDELRNLDLDHPAMRTIAHNRIMELVELFFTNLYEKRNQLKHRIKATAADIANIKKVEGFITQNYTLPCPPIEELSRIAGMSATKLKNLFKQIYNKPVYQYYQYFRMSKAKVMLLSGKITVKETSNALGYSNTGNFINAFKKVFDMLPGALLL